MVYRLYYIPSPIISITDYEIINILRSMDLELKMKIIKNLILIVSLATSISCSAKPPPSDFQSFWSIFRAASLANDYTTLITLTKFPLEVKGVDDSVPVKKYEKAQLNTIFPKLLSQPVFLPKDNDVVETTLRETLTKTEKVEYKPTDKEIRVEQFQFQFIDGKWLLVRAYLEE